MLFFAIVFVILGLMIGSLLKEESVAITSILVITVIWAFVYGPWAIATFIELIVGYGFAKNIKTRL